MHVDKKTMCRNICISHKDRQRTFCVYYQYGAIVLKIYYNSVKHPLGGAVANSCLRHLTAAKPCKSV